MRVFVLALVAVAVMGCSKSPEDEMVDAIKEASKLLDGVTTKEQALKIKAEFGRLMQRAEKASKEIGDNPDMETLGKVLGPVMELGMKVAFNPEVNKVLEAEMKRIQK